MIEHIHFIYQFIIARMSNAQKPKKKYKKMQKKEQGLNEKIVDVSSISSDPTQTQINLSKAIDVSSIHPINMSSITENTSVLHNQTSFIGSAVNLKQQFLQVPNHEQYINCKQTIEDKDLLKILKKYTKKIFDKIKDIEILQSEVKPQIIFEFQDEIKSQRVRRSLRDLLKANKELGQKQSKTISQIFDKLYHRIGEQFYKIMQIVLKIADKQRVELKINPTKLSKNPMLYYCINQKLINFALFDPQMRMFQFNSQMVAKIGLESKHQKLWKKFGIHIDNKRRQNEKIIEQYGQYQASSDQQSRKTVAYRQKIDVAAIQQKLMQFFKEPLAQYEEEIEQKENLYNEIKNKDDDKEKEKLQKLAEEISQLHSNLENFIKIRESVQKQERNLRPTDGQIYKNLLKRMILAQKQLQSKLPIIARKRDLFSALDKEDLIILQGETGSGKSTQLPQMMCEYFKVFESKGKQILPILITQPRKLATRTVAERVASEMDQSIGDFVDYATSAHKSISKIAKIIFKMDTLVLDELTIDRTLSKYSCLIIDQAHQRTISIDVILGLIKQLQTKRKGFKVIVTSASLDAKLFSEYFKKKVMKVSGRLYPVQIIYRSFSHESDIIKKIENTIKKDILLNGSQIRPQYKGDILVFCSGVEQINILCNIFYKYLNPRVFQVYALHGRIAPSQQRQIFMKTKQYKLIFASRIAQTSITINGVKVVVDPGYDRQQVYDQKNRVSSRKLINISQSSAKQRAGRAGRTSKGFCFRLYSQAQLRAFRPNKTPQIQNMALDTLVLRLKMLNVKEIFKFAYVNKPQDKALQKSVQTLQMIGGLDFKGDVTIIGKLLLQLRIQPFLGRAIVEAIICQQIIKKTDFADKNLRKKWKQSEVKKLESIRGAVVQILCMVINSSNVFSNFNQFNKNRDRIEEVKFKKFSDQRGDFFYLQNIYDQFIYRIKQPPAQLNSWIHSRFLNKKTLYQTKELVEEINETIKSFKIDIKDPTTKKLVDIIKIRMTQCKSADDTILSCMMTSFCVNLCLYSNNPSIGYTLILQKKPIIIYGTSTLSLLSRYPKWIICYELKTNDKGITYCQIAHEVDYKFLKSTVDDHVFEKLNLRQAQYMNPYYETLDITLPTMILQEVSNEYINRENYSNPLFKHLSIITKQQSNTLSISYSKDLKMSQIFGFTIDTNIKQYLENYIYQKNIQKKQSKFVFHLLSNIYLQIKNGFNLENIYFTSKEVQFIAKGEDYLISTIKNIIESQGINCHLINKEKIKIFTIIQNEYAFVKSQLQTYGLKFEQFVKQQKPTSLNAKIYMKFYTGQRQDKPIFLYYGKAGQVAQQMCEILQNCRKAQNIKSSQQKYRYFNILCTSKFRVAKSGAGVKCFNDKIDAFQLKEAIQYLTINTVLPYHFKTPINIKQFREPDHNLAIKSQKDWQGDIRKIFQKNGFKDIEIKVKVDDRQVDEKQIGSNMQRLIKHELTAQLTAQNIQKLDDLVKKFDGKQKLIGVGKIHFRYNFRQHIVKINKCVFQSLKSKFDYLKDFYQLQYSQLRVETQQKIFTKVQNIMISCRCTNRQRLLQPSQKIKDLFTPFLIRLEPAQFNFLFNSQEGEDFLSKVEQDYRYGISFGFDKRKSIIKVYCEQQQQFQQIEERVLKIFDKYKFVIEKISYRGKGLNRVVQVIQKQRRAIQQKKSKKNNVFVEYSIIFRWREVEIEGDPQSIKRIKQNIASLQDEKPGSCQICLKNTEKPYKLFNCLHSFCWKCLGNYVEEGRKRQDNDQDITCPSDNCNRPISPHDIKVILSTQEFQSFSMRRVKFYVKKNNKKYFFCPTNGCDQIFQSDSIAKSASFQCYICGKWFCSKCRQPHEHFTCKEWQQKLAKGQLSKFGYKKCKCGSILQKQQREKTIKCKNCQQYLCWDCLRGWKAEKDCKNHVRTCKK